MADAGGKTTVVGPDGGVFEAPTQDLAQLTQMGYRPETPEEVAARAKKKEYQSGLYQLAAGAAGVARGLTFGISDQILTRKAALTGQSIVDPEELARIKEANPTISDVSEIGSSVAGVLASGGLGALARTGTKGIGIAAGRGITAGPGAIARLGGAVERGLMGGAQSAARRALAKGAGSAVEGAFYGAGKLVSEDALGEADLTAENLLAYAGTGAVLGGVSAGALSMGGSALRAGGRVTKDAFDRIAQRHLGRRAATGLYSKAQKLWAKGASAFSGADEDDLVRMTDMTPAGKRLRQAATADGIDREQITRQAMSLLDDFAKQADDITEEAVEGKAKNIARFVRKDGQERVLQETSKQLSAAQQQLESIADEPGYYSTYFATKAKRALKEIKSFRKRLLQAEPGEDFNAEAFVMMDQLKRRMSAGQYRRGFEMLPADQKTGAQAFDDVYELFRQGLEDTTVWGKAGEVQGKINAAWARHLNRGAKFKGLFLDRMGREGAGLSKTQYAASGRKLGSFLDNVGTAKTHNDEIVFREYLESRQDLIETITKAYDLPEDKLGALGRARENTQGLFAVLKDAEEKVAAQNQLKELMGGSDLGILGGVAGAQVFGLPGAVAGAGLQSVSRPGLAIKQLAAIERMAARVNQRMGDGVKRFIRRASRTDLKLRRTVAPVAVGTLFDTTFDVFDGKKPRDRREAYKQRFEELQRMAASPAALQKRLSRNLAPIQGAAPNTAAHLGVQAQSAASYLHEHAPKPPPPSNRFRPEDPQDWVPSDAEIDAFENRLRVVENPLSVLEDLERGTLSFEAVDALKTVYPRLYDRMVVEISQQIPAMDQDLGYDDKVQLSMLFDLAIDPSLEPQAVAALQAVWMPREHQNMSAHPPSRTADIEKAQDTMTEAQRLNQ